MLENKLYKISQDGGSYVTASFYNPITKEHKHFCVRDYDYDCFTMDRQFPNGEEAYFESVSVEALKVFNSDNGIIDVGSTVEVVKGRKMKIGYTGVVTDIKNWYDHYKRLRAIYVHFADGQKTSIENCKRLA